MMGQSNGQCLVFISLMSLPLLAGTLWALRRGASTRPALSGALAGLLSGGAAAVVYSLHCTEDSPLFYAPLVRARDPRRDRRSARSSARVSCAGNARSVLLAKCDALRHKSPLRYDNRPAVFLATVARLPADHAKPPHTAGGTKTGDLHDG